MLYSITYVNIKNVIIFLYYLILFILVVNVRGFEEAYAKFRFALQVPTIYQIHFYRKRAGFFANRPFELDAMVFLKAILINERL